MNQKGFVNIALVVLIVVLAGAVGYFAFVKKPAPSESQPTDLRNISLPTSSDNEVSRNPVTDETANWITQKIDKFGVQAKCPASCGIDEKSDLNSAFIKVQSNKLVLNPFLDVISEPNFGNLEYPAGEYFGSLTMHNSEKFKDNPKLTIYFYDFGVNVAGPEIGILGGKTIYYLRANILDKEQEFGERYQYILSLIQSSDQSFNKEQKDLFRTIL